MEQIRDRLKARLQADGEYKSNKELLCDSCYRKIAGCQAKFHNPHPVDHCIEYKPIEKQADGDLISRKDTLRKAFYVSTESFDGSVVDAEVIFKMPSVAIPSAEPKTGYISIDDVMSVFDDFMCGEVDEDGMDTFLEMLKDKAERSE